MCFLKRFLWKYLQPPEAERPKARELFATGLGFFIVGNLMFCAFTVYALVQHRAESSWSYAPQCAESGGLIDCQPWTTCTLTPRVTALEHCGATTFPMIAHREFHDQKYAQPFHLAVLIAQRHLRAANFSNTRAGCWVRQDCEFASFTEPYMPTVDAVTGTLAAILSCGAAILAAQCVLVARFFSSSHSASAAADLED